MIAIPNMEKPTQCYDCRLISSDGLYCRMTHNNVDWSKVNSDCPLIEIPDEIWEALKPKVDTMSMALKGWVEDVLKNKNGFGVDNGKESR